MNYAFIYFSLLMTELSGNPQDRTLEFGNYKDLTPSTFNFTHNAKNITRTGLKPMRKRTSVNPVSS